MYTLEGTGEGKEAVSSKQGGANVSGIIICKPRHYIPRNTCVSRGVFAFPSNRYRGKPGDGAASAEANKPRVVIIDWVLLSPKALCLAPPPPLVDFGRSIPRTKRRNDSSTPSSSCRVPFWRGCPIPESDTSKSRAFKPREHDRRQCQRQCSAVTKGVDRT